MTDDGSQNADKPISIGRFVVLGELGRGGMGIVYWAQQFEPDREVAVKVLSPGNIGPERIARFSLEAQIAGRLEHPHIVPIFESGKADDVPYLVMPMIEGMSLADHCGVAGIDPRQAAKYVMKVAAAIHYAHEQGVLHRDIKPSNVIIDEHDEPRVTDFGLARAADSHMSGMTATGQQLGTRFYISPEQEAGYQQSVDRGSDVYSLGATLVETLVGNSQFRAMNVQMSLHQWMREFNEPLRRIDERIPVDLEEICKRCLAPLPSQRYATAAQMADDLRRFLDGKPLAEHSELRPARQPVTDSYNKVHVDGDFPASARMAAELWVIYGLLGIAAAAIIGAGVIIYSVRNGLADGATLVLVLPAVLKALISYVFLLAGRRTLSGAEPRLGRNVVGSLGIGAVWLAASFSDMVVGVGGADGRAYIVWGLRIEAGMLLLAGLQGFWGLRRYRRWIEAGRAARRLWEMRQGEQRRSEIISSVVGHWRCQFLEPVLGRPWHFRVNSSRELIVPLPLRRPSAVCCMLDAECLSVVLGVVPDGRTRFTCVSSPDGRVHALTSEEMETILNVMDIGQQEIVVTRESIRGPGGSFAFRDERYFPQCIFEDRTEPGAQEECESEGIAEE